MAAQFSSEIWAAIAFKACDLEWSNTGTSDVYLQSEVQYCITQTI